MSKSYYILSTPGNWMASSGNAILAMQNITGSGKKVNIHNVSIFNNTKMGFINGAAGSNTPAPMRVKVSNKIHNILDGTTLTPQPMDSNATFPSGVNIKTKSSFVPKFSQRGPIYTPTGAVTAGSGTFTPTTAPSPAWVTSEHRDAGRYFICVSGAGNVATFTANTNSTTTLSGITDFSNIFEGNYLTGTGIPTYAYITAIDVLAGQVTISAAATQTNNNVTMTCARIYKIIANTATALTVDPPFAAGVVTGGYIADTAHLIHACVQKQLNTSTTASYPQVNFGTMNRKDIASGGIWDDSMHTNTQEITVRAGENLVVYSDAQHSSFPLFVSCDLIVSGTPNRTYNVEFYTYLTSENTAILSIENTVGSGQTLYFDNIDISECGTTDTCYFRLVPIGTIDSETFQDSNRLITSSVTKNDSNAPSLSGILDWYTNTPILPYGVPVSYMSSASPGASTVPVGYNYLNTKDFQGPMWMSYFPEGCAWKPENQAGMWTAATPSTHGSHLSEKYSCIKGMYAPIVIRPGEGFAITSGAETASVATVNSVGVSAWGGFDFMIYFSVENERYPSINLTGMVQYSRFSIETYPGAVMLYQGEADATGNYSYQYVGSLPQQIRIRVRKSSTQPKYLPFEIVINLTTTADVAVQISQDLNVISS